MIEKHLIKDDDEHNDLRTIDSLVNNKTKLDSHTKEILDKIKSLEDVYNSGKKELQQMKKAQLDRISKEFLVGDYVRRFKTTLNKVVSAIVGEENLTAELIRQSREEKEYHEKIKKAQFFNFYDNKFEALKQKAKII